MKKPTNKKKLEDRKLELIEVAIKLIGTIALTDLSLETVGKKCGMRRSHVAYYFKDIDELVQASILHVITYSQKVVTEFLAEANDADEKIRALVFGYGETFLKKPTYGRVFALLNFYGTYQPVYKKICTEITDVAEQRIAAILAARMKLKTSLIPENIKSAARHLRSTLLGRLLIVLTYEKPVDYDEEMAKITEYAIKICKTFSLVNRADAS